MRIIHLGLIPDFKPGDPKPSGYMERSEWANVQLKAGLRQKRCRKCGLWRFPQEPCVKGKCDFIQSGGTDGD